ncbi:hypothetical protein OG345_05300 [Streptomyces sp. NBC_01220]|uniref:hypothetical protein n=1 Tax=Streptomyces sp. NBC_01220 TaxID=2903781 RepID=UPI00352EBE98|nr:hypothetical protein OG345_05300 [Streptomyces sp. NBC_01220]
MPTGPLHDRAVNSIVNGEITQEVFPCRCVEGDDHIEGPTSLGGEEEEDEGYSVPGAEEIWLSSGMDEDYDFR